MNVLILSDFSEVAINATHYAMDLLQQEKVDFTLLNIYVPNRDDSEEQREEKKAAILERLHVRVQKLTERSEGRDHRVKGHFSEDNLVKAARNYLQDHHVDLLVMGAVGEERRFSTILGDHTFEIMLKVKCNILAVPDNVKFRKPEKLLMPLDASVFLKRKNLRFLNNEDLFRKTHLDVWRIGKSAEAEANEHQIQQEILEGIEGVKVTFQHINKEEGYNMNTWTGVQQNYDLVLLPGKNVDMCDHLLNNRHGIYNSMPNRLPILVLHD